MAAKKKAHLSSLISDTDLSSSITTLSSTSFDPRGEYAGVLRAVQDAASSGAEVKVYRVEIGTSRCFVSFRASKFHLFQCREWEMRR